jgi:hypothetical protein
MQALHGAARCSVLLSTSASKHSLLLRSFTLLAAVAVCATLQKVLPGNPETADQPLPDVIALRYRQVRSTVHSMTVKIRLHVHDAQSSNSQAGVTPVVCCRHN